MFMNRITDIAHPRNFLRDLIDSAHALWRVPG